MKIEHTAIEYYCERERLCKRFARMAEGEVLNCCNETQALRAGGSKRLNLFIKVVKFFIDYNIFLKDGYCMEFSNDYTRLRKLSFPSIMVNEYHDKKTAELASVVPF